MSELRATSESTPKNWQPRAVIFDFDGTLVDTMQSFADTAADVMQTRHGLQYAQARARYLETSGIPFFQQLEVIFPGHDANAAAAEEFERRKLDAFFEESFDDDVRSTLSSLSASGVRVAVSSNNFQHLIDRFVARESVDFDMVLGCRDGFFKGRDHFEALFDAFSLTADDLLFVGDSLMDAVRAAECSVRFVGRTGTFTAGEFAAAHPGTPTIEKLADLPSAIESLQAQIFAAPEAPVLEANN